MRLLIGNLHSKSFPCQSMTSVILRKYDICTSIALPWIRMHCSYGHVENLANIAHKGIQTPAITCYHKWIYSNCRELDTSCVLTQRRRYSTHVKDETPASNPGKKPPVNYIMALVGVYISVTVALYWRSGKNRKDPPALERLNDPLMKSKDAEGVKHGEFWLPESLVKDKGALRQIAAFPVRDGDVCVASFPKSGTTWIQEIIYLILHNADTRDAEKETIEERFPYLEFVYPGLKTLAARPSPRLVKSHLPYSLLPAQLREGKGKIIYIGRNPKDVSVSYYHFVKMLTMAKYQGDFSQFFQAFISGRVNYGPWVSHVKEYWLASAAVKQPQNLLFVTYEELQQNLPEAVEKIGVFLGKKLSVEQVAVICRHCSFRAMRLNPATNYSWWDEAGLRDTTQAHFMRKGRVGDWENYYSDEMRAQVDRLCDQHLKPHMLVFKDRL